MSKKEMIDALAEDAKTTQAVTERVLNALSARVAAGLSTGDNDVSLPGIGKLTVTHRGPRQGRNPRTGEAVSVPASKRVKFTPYKALKDAVA